MRRFSITPLLFEGLACTMSLTAFVAIVGPVSRLIGLAPWQVGLAVTMAGAAWALCARLWGHAADRFGKRRIMLLGLGGFALSYGMLALFIEAALRLSLSALATFAALLIFRTLAGAFYAAVPASSVAFISDRHAPEKRAGAVASLGAANGLGMVLGPAAAGLLAQYDLSLTLLFIVVLPVAALVVVWRALPADKAARASNAPLKLSDPRIGWPLAIALVAMTCTSAAQIVVGFYALDRLNLALGPAIRVAGICLGAVGLALLIARAAMSVLRPSERTLVQVGALIAALGFGAAAFADNELALIASYFAGAIGMGFLFPAFYALGANAVDAHEQGAVAGAISSAQGLGSIVGPLIATLTYQIAIGAPYLLISIALVALAVSFGVAYRPASGTGSTKRAHFHR